MDIMDRKTKKRFEKMRQAEEKLSFATPSEASKLTEKIAKWKAQLFT
jgi:hypothetical protein